MNMALDRGFMYPITRWLFRTLFFPRYHFTVSWPNEPIENTPMIVVANHNSLFDPWVISSLFPDQRICWVAKRSIFQKEFYHELLSGLREKVVRMVGQKRALSAVSMMATLIIYVLRHCDTLSVDVENPSASAIRSFFSSACSRFREGKSIGIFPEGGINPEKKRVNLSGVLVLTRKLKCPVVQVRVDYARRHIIIFPPLFLSKFKSTRA
jgi:1-acyl-sn-glycerol-3-phosphate acyltransferase